MTAGTITLALRTAQSGLLANQSALDAVANNISNVNSPNYSRKVVAMEQRVLAGAGAGVQIAAYQRKVDEGLLKSLRQELSTFQQYDIQTDYYDRMQDLFGEPGQNNSISHVINEFTKALESLSLHPDKTLEQSELIRWGQDIGQMVQDMTVTIQDLRLQADGEINDAVDQINTLIGRIGDANDSIVRETAVGNDATSLEDQRDQALNELAELIDINYYFRSDGDVVVFTNGGRTLVDNIPATLTHRASSAVVPTTTHAEGDFSSIYVGSELATNDITDEIRDGRLKGLVELRDNVLPNLQAQMDELSSELRDAFNQIHNRGLPHPGSQSLTGTRRFVDSATSTVNFAAGDDTRIVLFNSAGEQQAQTSLDDIMVSAGYGSGAQASSGSWTVDEVAATIEDWLQANGAGTASVAVDATTHTLKLDLNTTTLNVAFRDEAALSSLGATHEDASIAFDSNGDGVTDETVGGFCNFFGLNDFFVDSLNDSQWQSGIVSSTYTVQTGTLTISNAAGAMTGTPLAITAGWTLSEVADAINTNVTDITATVVPEGSGYRLRVVNDNGSDIYLSVAATQTFLSDLGMAVSESGVSSSLAVRSDIVDTPGYVSRGAVQWDADKGVAGEYYSAAGDDTIVQALAAKFTGTNGFDKAGGLENLTIGFSDYAAAIVGRNATLAGRNDDSLAYQENLTNSMQTKSDQIKGVNLDEEMSQLILFEQAYSAAARVITIIQSMFDALDRAVG